MRKPNYKKMQKQAAGLMACTCGLEAEALRCQHMELANRMATFRGEVAQLQEVIKSKLSSESE